jgi:hypothetical protein
MVAFVSANRTHSPACTVKDNGAVDGNEPRDVDTMVSKQCCDGH